MGSATTFTCDYCGQRGLGVPGDYQYQDPPWGWTWYWGSVCAGPHGCSAECWDAIQEHHRAATGKVYLPDSHERRAQHEAESRVRPPPPAAVIPAPCQPSDDLARRVYFVQRGDAGPVKIGISKRLRARLNTLQTAFPEPLKVLAAVPGTREDEARLHARFGVARIAGEWFAPHPDLLDFVRGVAERGAL